MTPVFDDNFDPRLLPVAVQRELLKDEEIGFWAQPIRFENGIGVWLIFSLGWLFTPAAVAVLFDFFPRFFELFETETALPWLRIIGASLLLIGILAFLAFGVLLFLWPWRMRDQLNRTHILITNQRALHIRTDPKDRIEKTRVRAYRIHQCTDTKVVRRRAQSATLLLKEGTREKRVTGKILYEWDAFHGIPRADHALATLLAAQKNVHREEMHYEWQTDAK